MNEFNNRLLELAKVLYEKGFDKRSIPSFSERLHSVQKGLSAEAEFAATVSWLRNCDAIFKLETNPATAQAGKLKAPDFIAFPIVRERRVPVLIEVKSRWKK